MSIIEENAVYMSITLEQIKIRHELLISVLDEKQYRFTWLPKRKRWVGEACKTLVIADASVGPESMRLHAGQFLYLGPEKQAVIENDNIDPLVMIQIMVR